MNDAPSGLGRVIQLFMYVRSHPEDNHYAHPLDFVPVADLNLKKVRRLRRPVKSLQAPVMSILEDCLMMSFPCDSVAFFDMRSVTLPFQG